MAIPARSEQTTATSTTRTGWRLLTGAIFGVIGAVAMGMYAMVVALIQMGDFWMPMKGIAATFLGEAAMQPGFALGPVLIGMMFHLSGSWPLSLVQRGAPLA